MNVEFLYRVYDSIRCDFRDLKGAPPGRRFREFCKRKKAESGKRNSLKYATVIVAIILIVVGLAIGWLPGPGGFLAIVGAALLTPYFPGVAILMDKIEIYLRRLIAHFWPSNDGKKMPHG